ncbi:MAG: ATP-dependent helicase, partial [Pseudomonadota bacterium]
MKLAINPMDNMAFLLIKDVIGTSREKYSAIRVMAAESGKSHFQTWFEVSGGDTLNIFQPDLSLAEICNEICTLYPELSPEASAFIYNWEKEHPDSIEEYLNWLALYEVQDEIKKETAGISLMTIHAAKGLEWPVVILTGINEGIIPSKQSVNANDVEAERRLFYVAMTRTRDQLIMTVRPETVEKDGRIFESPQSRFIAEAKEDELSIL